MNQLRHERDRIEGPDPNLPYVLFGLPEGDRRVPFPATVGELLADRKLYAAYNNLLVAHRNQGFNYQSILERARRLRGEVHRELQGTLDPGNCQLVARDGRYTGSCGPALAEGRELRLELSEAEGVLTGAWWRDRPPNGVFSGRSNLGPDETGSEVTVEADVRGRGLIRTAAGWFAVSGLTPPTDGGRLSFSIYGDREVAPDTLAGVAATGAKAARPDGSMGGAAGAGTGVAPSTSEDGRKDSP